MAQRHLYISTLLVTLVAFLLGCGSDKKTGTDTRRGGIPGNNAGKNGKTPTGGTGDLKSPTAADRELKNHNDRLDAIEKAETPLTTGNRSLKEDLDAGIYELDSVTSTFLYMKKSETVRAMHKSDVKKTFSNDGFPISFQLPDVSNAQSEGIITGASDSGRTLEIPVRFTIATKGVLPPTKVLMRLVNLLKPIGAGKAQLTDELQAAASNEASVWNILTTGRSGEIGKDKGDRVYEGSVDNIKIYLRLIKETDALRIWAQFIEKEATAKGENTITQIRSLYLKYAFKLEEKPPGGGDAGPALPLPPPPPPPEGGG